MVKASTFTAFRLLTWKNWVLQKRRPIGTFFELVVPVVLFLMLWAIRSLIKADNPPDTVYCSQFASPTDAGQPYNDQGFSINGQRSVSSNTLPCSSSVYVNDRLLPRFTVSTGGGYLPPVPEYDAVAYAPDTAEVRQIMESVLLQFQLGTNTNFTLVGFPLISDLSNIGDSSDYSFLLGVGFFQDNNGFRGDPGIDVGSKRVHYVLRMPETALPEWNQDGWQTGRSFPEWTTLGPEYFQFYDMETNAWVGFQAAIDTALMNVFNGDSWPGYTARLKPMPWPSYSDDTFIYLIRGTIPMILVFAFIYSAATFVIYFADKFNWNRITRELVFEKEQRLKEAMSMMGLSTWVHWVAWFTKCFLFLFVSVCLITMIFAAAQLVKHSDNGVVFFLFILFAISVIAFCFMLSTFFSRSNIAAAAGGILFFLSYVPYLFIQNDFETLSKSEKGAACLLAPTCVGIGSNILAMFETSGVGLTFANLRESPTEENKFSMADVYGMLILDTVLYLIITWYVENVFPGEFGIGKPFYFFVLPSYWSGSEEVEDAAGGGHEVSNDMIEGGNSNAESGIVIENLRKVFKAQTGGDKVAVESLSMKMYKNQITALLGHNGAGKTTTLSMLVGLYPPSSGTAFVNGYDITTNIEDVRDSLGICPQFDTLFPRLTVAEHLIFYSRLKGLSVSEAKAEVGKYLKDIDLENKENAQTRTLSGGQRRALSCAIALVGDSKIVILDEPTSGMDPYKRHQTWDMLLKHKQGRTMVLTTHFMEEADLLGDRIAIMAHGQLRTLGSSMFLKNRFGVGYHMTVVKAPGCDANAVFGVVAQVISDAEMTGNVGSEMSVIIPKRSSSKLPDLFKALEIRQEKLKVESLGLSVTTMEEVFLKVSEVEIRIGDNAHKKNFDQVEITGIEQSRYKLDTGRTLYFRQFYAMFMKRYLYSMRNRSALISQILLPLLFAFAAISVAKWGNAGEVDEPEMLFGFSSYGSSPLRYSSSNTAGDYWSFIGEAGQQQLTSIAQGDSSLALQAKASMQSLIDSSSDARFSPLQFIDRGGLNFSNSLLADADNYNKNRFFQKNLAAVSTERGEYRVRFEPNSQQCQLWTPSGWQNVIELTIKLDEVASFALIGRKNDNDHQDRLSFDGFQEQWGAEDDPFNASRPICLSNSKVMKCDWVPSSAWLSSGDTVQMNCHSSTIVTAFLNLKMTSGAATTTDAITAYGWYSLRALHAVPQTLNLLSNAVLQARTGDNSARIYTYNHPLPKSSTDAADEIATDETGFQVAIFLIFATAFLMASWTTFVVSERATKAKHIQFVSGVKTSAFWLANYSWDLITLLPAAIGLLIVFAAFDTDAYRGDRLGLVFLLFLLFGWSAIPLMYLLSKLFSTSAGAFAMTSILFVIGGIGMLLAILITGLVGEMALADNMRYGFFFVPNFAFGQALYDVFVNNLYDDRCAAVGDSDVSCQRFQENYLSMDKPGVGLPILYLALTGPVWFLLLLLIEWDLLPNFVPPPVSGPPRDEDTDVAAERRRVESGAANQDKVVVKDLTRVYRKSGSPTGRFTAVDNLTFGIPSGECFGLLGVNGAGKTTTFRMLTGDENSSQGTIVEASYNIATHLKQARQYIGYCPQYDALIGLLTAREHLVMYARLRGVPEEHVHEVAATMVNRMNLDIYADKPSHTYSGGNKRKLSTAIALIGDPQIVFLDEPSTGVDPAAKRFLWNVLEEVKANGQVVVLTSHSMEECEALCSRLAIMVNGKFRCIGSPGHLKARFGQGYMLHAKLEALPDGSARDTSALKMHIEKNLAGAELKEEHNGSVSYQIKGERRGWSYMFEILEAVHKSLHVEDYSLSQTSLESVFLGFAGQQHDDELEREGIFGKSKSSVQVTRFT